MGIVIAVSGLPAAGKGEFAAILAARGIPVRSMGDMVRAEVKARGIEEAPHVFGEVAMDLRAKYGDDILAHRLVEAVDNLLQEHSIVLIEGMRGTAEREVFQSHWGDSFSTVAIEADLETRFQRVLSRARSEDGGLEELKERDRRETGWGLDTIIAEADKIFTNQSDLDDLTSEVSVWLDTL